MKKNGMTGVGRKTGGMGSGSHLTAGLTRKNPPESDASMVCKGGSVDDGAVRSGVAPTPRTLGPRTA